MSSMSGILNSIPSQGFAPQAQGERTRPRLANYDQFIRQCCNQKGKYKGNWTQLLLFVDADNLKHVNDSLGHSAGDDLIETMYTNLETVLAPDTIICRKGGDEFLAYCICESSGQAESIARDVTNSLNRVQTIQNQDILLSCSVGAAIDLSQSFDIFELLDRADTALILAKRSGKQQLRIFDLEECKNISFERSLVADFAGALCNESLEVFFQPIFNIGDRSVGGAEALIRWEHDNHGFVPTDKIISAAIRSGHMRDLGEFVLRAGCQSALTWPDQIFLSVNFAASDFQQIDFVKRIAAILSTTGLSPERVHMEITELEYLVLNDVVVRNVTELQALGVKIGVDDFGTGYSSMGSIDSFPADFLKIDRSLVENCDTRPSSKIFLRAIQMFAQQSGQVLIAEGVETLAELAVVRSIGIGMAQGFYYSAALPKDEFGLFVKARDQRASLSLN